MMWSAIEWVKYGKPSALGIVTGMVAGLGTITPASGFVGPGGALVIGLAAGFVCFFATHGLKRVLKIDDSLDVFPVHGVGGMLGTFAAGIFASSSLGVFSGQGYAEGMDMGSQLGVQLLGIGATIAYTAVLTWGLLKLGRRAGWLARQRRGRDRGPRHHPAQRARLRPAVALSGAGERRRAARGPPFFVQPFGRRLWLASQNGGRLLYLQPHSQWVRTRPGLIVKGSGAKPVPGASRRRRAGAASARRRTRGSPRAPGPGRRRLFAGFRAASGCR